MVAPSPPTATVHYQVEPPRRCRRRPSEPTALSVAGLGRVSAADRARSLATREHAERSAGHLGSRGRPITGSDDCYTSSCIGPRRSWPPTDRCSAGSSDNDSRSWFIRTCALIRDRSRPWARPGQRRCYGRTAAGHRRGADWQRHRRAERMTARRGDIRSTVNAAGASTCLEVNDLPEQSYMLTG